MADDLLPCPFCGSSDVTLSIDDYNDPVVICENCTARGPTALSDRVVITKWNKRAAPDAMTRPARHDETDEADDNQMLL